MKVSPLLSAFLLAAALSAAAAETPREASFADFDRRAREGAELSVVFFGGSLTWSANASDPDRTGFRPLVAERLRAKYPAARFRFHDAAIGGTGSTLGVFRLDRDVLAHEPDLVFLDFSCNDPGGPEALAQSCCYESVLRRLVGRGVPVVQVFFTFRFWSEDLANPGAGHPQLAAYRRLAEAYQTGVGDVYRDGPLFPDLRAGRVSLDDVWPFDGAHPGDLGYRYFADAGIAGFEHAVSKGVVCRVPEKPVFGDVADVTRRNFAWSEKPHAESAESAERVGRVRSPSAPDLDLSFVDNCEHLGFVNNSPAWTLRPAYRTSLWYDGLSSRWMDGVAVFAGTNRAPIEVRAKANLVGVFGEADEKALDCEVRADGGKIADFRGNHGAGQGRLFIWRQALLPGWERGEAEDRAFAFDPVPDGAGEFHVGAICTATIRPVVPDEAASTAAPIDLDAIDHGRRP